MLMQRMSPKGFPSNCRIDKIQPKESCSSLFSFATIDNDNVAQILSTRPYRHDAYKIIWITKGEGVCHLDQQLYSIGNDEVYCISPGQVHFFQDAKNCSGFVISFTVEYLYLSSVINPATTFKTLVEHISGRKLVHASDEKPTLYNILECIRCEFHNYSPMRNDILTGWVVMFLTYLRSLANPNEQKTVQGKNAELVDNFYARLEKGFIRKRMVTDYASELAVTPNYLNEIVKKVSGHPASHHIQQRIIIEAKRLAIYSNASMKEISYQLGFCDISYFSKFFKNFSGTNFKEFKKNKCKLSSSTSST